MKLKKLSVLLALGCGTALAGPLDSVTLSTFGNVGKVSDWKYTTFNNTEQPTEDALFKEALKRDALIMLSINAETQIPLAKSIVTRALREKRDIILEGKKALLAKLQPEQVMLWPVSDTMFISNRSGKRGNFFLSDIDIEGQTGDIVAKVRDDLTIEQTDYERMKASAQESVRASSGPGTGEIDLPAVISNYPTALCERIRDEVVAKRPEGVSANTAEADALKACQASIVARAREVKPYQGKEKYKFNANDVAINIETEYMILRSDNKRDPSLSKYFLWTKQKGVGIAHAANFGDFSWGHTWNDFDNFYDLAISSGWTKPDYVLNYFQREPQSIEPDSTFFRCTSSSAFCPVPSPILLKKIPELSPESLVEHTDSETFNVSGGYKASYDTTQAPLPKLEFSLNAGWSKTQTIKRTLKAESLTISPSVDGYSLSTRWRPNWAKIFDIAKVSGAWYYTFAQEDSGLARTFEPMYSNVWEIKRDGNVGTELTYTTLYQLQNRGCSSGSWSNYEQCNYSQLVNSGSWPWGGRITKAGWWREDINLRLW